MTSQVFRAWRNPLLLTNWPLFRKKTHKKFITYLSVECGAHALNFWHWVWAWSPSTLLSVTRVWDRRPSRPPAKPLGLCFFSFEPLFPTPGLPTVFCSTDTWYKYVYIKLLASCLHLHASPPSLTCCACMRKPSGVRPPAKPLVYALRVIVIFFSLRAHLFVLAPSSETLRGLGTIRPLGSRCRRFGHDPCSVSRVASLLNFLGLGHG